MRDLRSTDSIEAQSWEELKLSLQSPGEGAKCVGVVEMIPGSVSKALCDITRSDTWFDCHSFTTNIIASQLSRRVLVHCRLLTAEHKDESAYQNGKAPNELRTCDVKIITFILDAKKSELMKPENRNL